MSFNDMRAKGPVEWLKPDVHQWSDTLGRTISTEFPDLPAKINSLERYYDTVRVRVKTLYGSPADVAQKVETFLRMCDVRKNIKDADAAGVSCCGCLAMLYCLVAHYKFDDTMVTALRDVMFDIGTTCLQGYTHRMLLLIIALLRDMDMVEGVHMLSQRDDEYI
ncbi:MAG: hypothetical protein PHN45_00875 [Methylococcales bacterium]|nr:hypothetical protein [Methylococcales bacterium]